MSCYETIIEACLKQATSWRPFGREEKCFVRIRKLHRSDIYLYDSNGRAAGTFFVVHLLFLPNDRASGTQKKATAWRPFDRKYGGKFDSRSSIGATFICCQLYGRVYGIFNSRSLFFSYHMVMPLAFKKAAERRPIFFDNDTVIQVIFLVFCRFLSAGRVVRCKCFRRKFT